MKRSSAYTAGEETADLFTSYITRRNQFNLCWCYTAKPNRIQETQQYKKICHTAVTLTHHKPAWRRRTKMISSK